MERQASGWSRFWGEGTDIYSNHFYCSLVSNRTHPIPLTHIPPNSQSDLCKMEIWSICFSIRKIKHQPLSKAHKLRGAPALQAGGSQVPPRPAGFKPDAPVAPIHLFTALSCLTLFPVALACLVLIRQRVILWPLRLVSGSLQLLWAPLGPGRPMWLLYAQPRQLVCYWPSSASCRMDTRIYMMERKASGAGKRRFWGKGKK